MKLDVRNEIPVVFYNGSNYCYHFIIKELANEFEEKFECLEEDCNCFLEPESVKDNSVKYKYLSCNKKISNNIDEELKKRYKNTFKFFNNDINKSILFLREGVYH